MSKKRTGPKKKIGRPSGYMPVFAKQAELLAKEGKTDAQICMFFEISIRQFYKWRLKYPAFKQALTRGKAEVDEMVENALLLRACGYSHDAVKIMTRSLGEGVSVIEQVPFVEHHPPDVQALRTWLHNRNPDRWKDRHPVTEALDAQRIAEKIRDALDNIDGVTGS